MYRDTIQMHNCCESAGIDIRQISMKSRCLFRPLCQVMHIISKRSWNMCLGNRCDIKQMFGKLTKKNKA